MILRVHPITENCSRALRLGKHAVIGISPFNSYFSELRLQKLIRWGLSSFERFHMFVPDTPARYTLEALDTTHKKQVTKHADRQITSIIKYGVRFVRMMCRLTEARK